MYQIVVRDSSRKDLKMIKVNVPDPLFLIIHRNDESLLPQISELQRMSSSASHCVSNEKTPLTEKKKKKSQHFHRPAPTLIQRTVRPMRSGDGFSGGMRLSRNTRTHH